MTYSRELAAIHESGHCTLVLALGGQIRVTSIMRTAHHSGWTRYALPASADLADLTAIRLAGHEATMQSTGFALRAYQQRNLAGIGSDGLGVLALAEETGSDWWIGPCWDWCAELVRAYAPQISELTIKLLDSPEGFLPGEDVHRWWTGVTADA
jgi:hypothetical protein